MRKNAFARHGKRAAARLRAIRCRAAKWKRRARQAVTLALIAAGTAAAPSIADAQMGQMGMAPAGGVVNRAVNGFKELNANGPGWLYYGINAADRGLGYQGSYMTLGGFIPYSQDDLGGLWAADLRSHLSTYGGFFSNVGITRKQFLGGSLLGIGVYWDYDGDVNMYPATSSFGDDFGHAYNQVGISGEWLTDFGNLRSNGYIPVGTTAYTAGNPGTPFYQHFIMCQNGLDAALSGADLEVGAYVPGLSDWAGMISVGGYTFGNARYNWSQGPYTGENVVPYFGGVYTRLDMTFLENWDFSLQYNNDSYFDSTGFARLTYRMGGSRRRNVPDQMEQPMMRNEHIVRAHQEPIYAGNPANSGNEWYAIHVDNSAAAGGDGTYEHPYNTLAAGNAAATGDYDIVFVNPGNGTSAGYDTTFLPLAANQYLIGNGRSFLIDTVSCGRIDIATLTNGTAPILSNPSGPSIDVQNGLIVNNFTIQNSAVGIIGNTNLSGFARPGVSPFGPSTQADYAAGAAMVSNVVMDGQNNPSRRGVFLDGARGKINFSNTTVQDMTNGGLVVNRGNPDVTYQGTITGSSASSPAVVIDRTTGGTYNLAVGAAPLGNTPNSIVDNGGLGIQIGNPDATLPTVVDTVNVGNANLSNNPTAVAVRNTTGPITFTDSVISHTNADGAAILVDGGTPVLNYGQSNTIANTGGYLLSVQNTAAAAAVNVAGATQASITDQGSGILVSANAGDVSVTNATIDSDADGILVQNSTGDNTFTNVTITGAGGTAGVNLQNDTAGTTTLNNVSITTNGAVGILADTVNKLVVGQGSTVNTTGQAALNLDAITTLSAAFNSASSSGSVGHGISITNSNTGVGTGVTINSTTITDSALNGINLVDNAPQGANGGSLLTANNAVISNTGGGQSGIYVENTNATFANATITGWTNSVVANSPNTTDNTILQVTNSQLKSSSGAAVKLVAGSGQVSATITGNTLQPVQSGTLGTPAVRASTGNLATARLDLDLSGNVVSPATTPANSIVLTNAAAGTLGVSQTAIAPATIQQVISSANGSATVVIVTANGVITQGVAVPTP